MGHRTALPNFLLLAPSLALLEAGYCAQSFLLQSSGIWEGHWDMLQILVKGFWTNPEVTQPHGALYTSHGHAASQALTAHKQEGSFHLPSTVLWSW